jgi:hypothetical protein
MTYYVRRERDDRVGWVGPIRSERQAGREATAWQECGWQALVFPSSANVRECVRRWQKAARAARRAS